MSQMLHFPPSLESYMWRLKPFLLSFIRKADCLTWNNMEKLVQGKHSRDLWRPHKKHFLFYPSAVTSGHSVVANLPADDLRSQCS